jgi:hypothetical protein
MIFFLILCIKHSFFSAGSFPSIKCWNSADLPSSKTSSPFCPFYILGKSHKFLQF